MNRIDAKFRSLRQKKEGAFIPYICGADPNLEVTRQLILALDQAGTDIIELGVPFSDPIADGPTIQKASERALKSRVTLNQLLDLVAELRRTTEIPIVLMGYYNPIFFMGTEPFFIKAKSVGVDGVIIPDLPIEESTQVLEMARSHDVKVIFLVAPTSTPERMKKIAEASTGFIYCVSVTGVTGARQHVSTEIAPMVAELRKYTEKPVCVGFGISNPGQAESVAKVADGVVIGSAIIDRIEANLGDETAIVRSVAQFATDLIQGIRG